jgi:hypothetical protein
MATLRRRVALAALVAGLAACHAPRDDYDRFLDATAAARVATQPIATSHYEDVGGRWLVNTLLAGGLTVGLRMRFSLGAAGDPQPMTVDVWLAASDPDVDPPLTTVPSALSTDGRFTIDAEPLILKMGSVKGLNVDVTANVLMDCYTQSKDEWCGGASGKVTQPLELDLAGSTLGALRDDDGTKMIADVPNHCP